MILGLGFEFTIVLHECLHSFYLIRFAGEKRCLNSELWHACAGPLVSLPAVGSRVVYFPQGHSEQVSFYYRLQLLLLDFETN